LAIALSARWFSTGTPVSFTNKADHYGITEILLKVALKHHNHNPIVCLFLLLLLISSLVSSRKVCIFKLFLKVVLQKGLNATI
jgi:hypothetical protein